MLRIGYVRGRPAESGDASGDGGGAARLSRAGCAVVHTEACGRDAAVLDSILGAIDAGDELVVTRLEHLGDSGRAVLEVLRRLEGRGAALRVLDPRRGPGRGGRPPRRRSATCSAPASAPWRSPGAWASRA
jgi:hypothetical protein